MAILISDLYGKQIITNNGQKLGTVEDIILDIEDKVVANLLLKKFDDLTREENTKIALGKNSVKYNRVEKVAEAIIVKATK